MKIKNLIKHKLILLKNFSKKHVYYPKLQLLINNLKNQSILQRFNLRICNRNP
jgi:hypothetical protein